MIRVKPKAEEEEEEWEAKSNYVLSLLLARDSRYLKRPKGTPLFPSTLPTAIPAAVPPSFTVHGNEKRRRKGLPPFPIFALSNFRTVVSVCPSFFSVVLSASFFNGLRKKKKRLRR